MTETAEAAKTGDEGSRPARLKLLEVYFVSFFILTLLMIIYTLISSTTRSTTTNTSTHPSTAEMATTSPQHVKLPQMVASSRRDMMETAEAAAAAGQNRAAGARDTTRLELQVCFFFWFSLLIPC